MAVKLILFNVCIVLYYELTIYMLGLKDYMDSFEEGLGDYLLLEADHIQSVAQGGSGDDVDNLQCLCWRCNRKKGGRRTNEEVMEMIDYGIGFDDAEEE